MNCISYSTDEKTNSVDYTNQLKFVCEESSVILEELNTINGFSVLDIKRSYGNSTYANANMVNYNLSTKTISYENFNQNSYENRNSSNVARTTSSLYNLSRSNNELSKIEKMRHIYQKMLGLLFHQHQ